MANKTITSDATIEEVIATGLKTCLKCGENKALNSFSKYKRSKDGVRSRCKECLKLEGKEYRIKNNEQLKKREAVYRADNKEKLKQQHKDFRGRNIEKLRENGRTFYKENRDSERKRQAQRRVDNKEKMLKAEAEYRKNNKEKIKETRLRSDVKNIVSIRASKSKWKKLNLDAVNACHAKRRGVKLNATPKWLTKDDYLEIKKCYTLAQLLQKETGIKYHVDHIIPLQGELVNGLHVPWNLQVITATENYKKSNKVMINV